LGKKATKKSKFNVSSPVDAYKFEFTENLNTTTLKNTFDFKNLNLNSTINFLSFNDVFDSSELSTNSFLFLDSFFFKKKSNFDEGSKSQFFKNDLIFYSLVEDKAVKQNLFKHKQLVNDKKNTPDLLNGLGLKTWLSSSNDSFYNFFSNGFFKKINVIQHTDLDDENRTVKRNSGKTTPLRVLKNPNSDFFFSNTDKSLELLRFRFNETVPTIANKPVRPTVYLTFKQKRYNQRTNIGKKTSSFFNRDLKKTQTYSGNPFLKDAAIIEENFGNPTRQYRMVKKAKSRLDTTRVGT